MHGHVTVIFLLLTVSFARRYLFFSRADSSSTTTLAKTNDQRYSDTQIALPLSSPHSLLDSHQQHHVRFPRPLGGVSPRNAEHPKSLGLSYAVLLDFLPTSPNLHVPPPRPQSQDQIQCYVGVGDGCWIRNWTSLVL